MLINADVELLYITIILILSTGTSCFSLTQYCHCNLELEWLH